MRPSLTRPDMLCSGVFDGKSWAANGEWSDAVAPATGEVMARVRMGTVQDLQRCTQAALDARADWAAIPAPRRGEIVRQIGNKFREVCTCVRVCV
jgi:aldehyde dehydrogenase family 7 protein A1